MQACRVGDTVSEHSFPEEETAVAWTENCFIFEAFGLDVHYFPTRRLRTAYSGDTPSLRKMCSRTVNNTSVDVVREFKTYTLTAPPRQYFKCLFSDWAGIGNCKLNERAHILRIPIGRGVEQLKRSIMATVTSKTKNVLGYFESSARVGN